MMAHIEGGAAFQWANDAQDTAFLAHWCRVPALIFHRPLASPLGDPIAIWWRRRWSDVWYPRCGDEVGRRSAGDLRPAAIGNQLFGRLFDGSQAACKTPAMPLRPVSILPVILYSVRQWRER